LFDSCGTRVDHQEICGNPRNLRSICLLCFCVGTAGAVWFGVAVKPGGLPPFLLTWEIVGGVLAAQVFVGVAGPLLSVVRLRRLLPEEAFRN
jgi:hypothetical protein